MIKIRKRLISKVLVVAIMGVMMFPGKVYAAEGEKEINLNCVKGFGYFFTQDFTCHSMHTEGKIAVGGKLTSIGNLSICTDENVNEPTLVVSKEVDVNTVQDKYGYCAVEKGCKIKKNSIEMQSHMNDEYKDPKEEHVFDFDSVEKELKEDSKELADLASDEEVVKNNGRMILTSNKEEGTAVFSITAQDIKDVYQQVDIYVNSNVTALINVKGETIDIPNSGGIRVFNIDDKKDINLSDLEKLTQDQMNELKVSEKENFENILWNFNEAQEIKLGLSYKGTILAPSAEIKITSPGNIEGQLIAKSFEQPKEIENAAYESHINLFTGSITVKTKNDTKEAEKPVEPEKVVEPNKLADITITEEYNQVTSKSENKKEEPKTEEPKAEDKKEASKTEEPKTEVNKESPKTEESKIENLDKGEYKKEEAKKEEVKKEPVVVQEVESKEPTVVSKVPTVSKLVETGDNMILIIILTIAMMGSAITIFELKKSKKNRGIN